MIIKIQGIQYTVSFFTNYFEIVEKDNSNHWMKYSNDYMKTSLESLINMFLEDMQYQKDYKNA